MQHVPKKFILFYNNTLGILTLKPSNMDSLRISERAKASLIVFKAIRPQILENRANIKKLREIIEPVNGFEWSRSLIDKVGSKPINDFMSCVKSSSLPQKEIEILRKLFKETFWNPGIIFPESWEIWRALITKYRLYEILPFSGWVDITHILRSLQITTPIELTELKFTNTLGMDSNKSLDGNLVILWQASKCWREEDPISSQTLSRKREENVQKLIKLLRVDSVEECQLFKQWDALRQQLGLPPNFDKLLPLTRNRLLLHSGERGPLIEDFLRLGGRINILRSVASSLRCLASGLNSYANICATLDRPFMPPSQETVLMWSATFADGRTFRNYVGHLKKGCLLGGFTLEWCTPAVKAASDGLRRAKRGHFAFPNFLYTKDIFRIISALGWEAVFSQLVFIAFLFSLRVPSEALQLRRAFADDPISEFVFQEEKALIGVRPFEGSVALIIKLSWRKNLDGGCVLRRPCLCNLRSRLGARICPPHRIWPLIKSRVDPGEPIFSQFTKNNFNTNLKLNLEKLDFKDAHRYTSKALRRGATQELTQKGETLEIIKGSGAWIGGGFRSYIDLEFDKALRVSQMIINLDKDSSSEDDSPRKKAPRKGAKTTKWVKGGAIPHNPETFSDSSISETSEEE